MQHHIIKSLAAIALGFLSFGAASAQGLWRGVATYSNWMVGGGSASTYTSYYRGMDVMTDMPQSKMKTLYLAKEKTLYSVMGMMGKPIVSSHSFDPDTMEVPLFDVASEMETIAGHNCVRVSYESGNAMVSEHSTVWLDTSYRIPFHYSLDDDIPYGLPVRTETRMKMKGMEVESVSELVSVVEGEVDDAIFAVPSTRFDENYQRFEHAFACFPEENPEPYVKLADRQKVEEVHEEDEEEEDDWRKYL